MDGETEERLYGSPAYDAVMGCGPTARDERVKAPDPVVLSRVMESICRAPSTRATEPAGTAPPLEVTTTAKVTGLPKLEGLGAEVTTATEGASTSWPSEAETLGET